MTSVREDMDKVIGRVKKMLALAHDTAASEGERDNALRMAHATLAKHNLSLAEAVAHGGKDEDRLKLAFFADGGPWARRCVDAVGGLFFCYYVYISRRAPGQGGKITHFYVGKEANVITAIELSQFVIGSIWKESACFARVNGLGGRERWSFAKGASEQISHRCRQLREAAKAQTAEGVGANQAPGTALVLASLYTQEREANKAQYLALTGRPPKEARAAQERDPALGALLAGRDYGKTISLQRQVTAGTKDRPRLGEAGS